MTAHSLRCARLIAAVTFIHCGCGDSESSKLRSPSILLITVDTLRFDHLGMYGYPRATSPILDRWFADGWVFDRAYATETATTPSVVSLLSGLLPQRHGVRLFYQQVPSTTLTAADHLRSAGYQTAAVVSNIVLTDEATGLKSRFDWYDDFVDEKESHRSVWERSARRTTDAALAWLETGCDCERPHFLWVHYIDPHGPYAPPADAPHDFRHSVTQPIDAAKVLPYQRDPEVDDAFEYVDRYDEEIAYCDREVGRLLDGYAQRQPVEDALVIFTADHGETMAEHEFWFTHQYDVHEAMARVPLALRIPGRQPARFTVPVSLVDVLPTILDVTGAPVPANLDGCSLLRFESGADGSDRPVFVEATSFQGNLQRRALVRGNQKWVVQVRRPDGNTGRKYRIDLDVDPGESAQRPWESSDRALAADLLERIAADPDPAGMPRQFRRGHQIESAKIRPDVSPETLEKLRAIGYDSK